MLSTLSPFQTNISNAIFQIGNQQYGVKRAERIDVCNIALSLYWSKRDAITHDLQKLRPTQISTFNLAVEAR
jgi:hypothetical protein